MFFWKWWFLQEESKQIISNLFRWPLRKMLPFNIGKDINNNPVDLLYRYVSGRSNGWMISWNLKKLYFRALGLFIFIHFLIILDHSIHSMCGVTVSYKKKVQVKLDAHSTIRTNLIKKIRLKHVMINARMNVKHISFQHHFHFIHKTCRTFPEFSFIIVS